MAYGRRKTKTSARSYSKFTSRARSRVRRPSGTARRKSSGSRQRVAAAKPQTIRIVFAQEPGGASLANPALPIPPSITTQKTGKAKL